METLKSYFSTIGFQGENLLEILEAFSLETFEKNDFVVEYGKTSKHIGFGEGGYSVLKDGEEKTQSQPHLLQHIPLQYLASTLGVTPRHLSRIRNNIR